MFTASTDKAIEFYKKNGTKFDFIFIDADHSYEQVYKDIVGCRELLSPNGIISGHDYGSWEGVARAVHELLPEFKTHNSIWYSK